jgi:hypothetical protein
LALQNYNKYLNTMADKKREGSLTDEKTNNKEERDR